MGTSTGSHDETAAEGRPRDAELVALFKCARCGLPYAPSRSTSALKLTYCSFLCELGDLGFSISGLEMMERGPSAAPASEPAATDE
jgi:hypothetical protein